MNGSLYDLLLRPIEKFELSSLRMELLSSAKGKVLEIGAGTGLNFPHYSKELEVVATDPDESMLKKARKRIRNQHIKVELADAQNLPFKDNEFDTVVATLVFCSIPNPDQALAEVYRVLKSGGDFLLLEHVRRNTPLLGKVQDGLTPIWKKIAGGCHLNRDPSSSIIRLGFKSINNKIIWHGVGKVWHLKK